MSSNHHTDPIFNEKKRPKNPIKFNLSLNSEQKEAKKHIIENPVTILRGAAGSGKTLVACQAALDMLFTKQVERIIITRPTVSKEEIGFLPGDIKEKMDPWLAPVHQNLFKLYNKDKVMKEIDEGRIEIIPFAFMRGITFTESFVIVDEAQNVTHNQMEMVIGRLGRNSKMVICGDVSQIDLRYKKESGFAFLPNIEAQVEGFKLVTLRHNHRHDIVQPILDIYSNYRD
jgi:phosphate starvation-inducible PhoH-like protein